MGPAVDWRSVGAGLLARRHRDFRTRLRDGLRTPYAELEPPALADPEP